jgi:hypothetical protein
MAIKTTLKNLAYSGAVLAGLAGIVGSQFSGCNKTPDNQAYQTYPSETPKNAHTEPKYTLNDFKRLVGKERLEGINGDWKGFEIAEAQKDRSLEELFLIYQNPEEYIKNLKPKAREKYDKFNPEKNLKEYFTVSELEDLQKRVPWRIVPKNKKFTESDKAMLFEFYSWKNFSIGPISLY